jgi:hypothetical protein
MKREEILQKIDALCIRTKPTGTETQHDIEVSGKIRDSVTILWWDYTSADQDGGDPKDKWHASLNVFDGNILGGISGYCDEPEKDVFCFATKTCDTAEKVMEFLDKGFAAWTCNMEEK